MKYELRTAGQKRANPKARIDNNLKLPLDIAALSGQDTLAYTTASSTAVTAWTYDGVVYPLTGVTANDSASIKAQIYATLRGLEIRPILKVSYAGGQFLLTHVGGAAISGVTIGGTSRTTTRKTTVAAYCDSVINVVGSVTPLGVDAGSNAVSGTYAFTGTSATDLTTAASMKTAIETAITALSAPITVKVVPDNVAKNFRVVFYGAASVVVTLQGTATTQKNFVEIFV